ncbi:MFS transporter [Lentzea sp. NBRC 105346]|uniref:MDR family MFS transporter n=1 Tax=Lentzea sp. NBRC 105346 TaxID=3032205 RepID=UPI0024A27F22|nr:MDR family MFS transporter [Lentzea sp. NBRC 105346]GLZ32242.1 MFS transporter [Lentzea sp. NBRC 105346]
MTTLDERAATGAQAEEARSPLGWLCTVLVLGSIPVLLDGTIVNIAIRDLAHEFGSSLATIQWVTTGYLLALSVVIPLSGWAMERFGAKQMWLWSQALFLTGSVLGGLAWSTTSLVVFRTVQGLGGGLMLPVAQAILAQAAGPQRIGKMMAIVSIPAMLSPVLGPVLGGLIIDYANWRWIFFINIPITLVAMALSAVKMAPTAKSGSSKLDVVGLLLISPGLGLLMFGLGETSALPTIAGVLLLVAFAVKSLRTDQPLIDLRLFRNRTFAAATITSAGLNAIVFGALILLPLYFQAVRGESVLSAGLLLAPQGVGFVVASVFASKLTYRITPVGIVIAVAATIPFALAGPDTNAALLAVTLFVRGFGIALANVPAMAAPYTALGQAAIPRATSALNIFQRVGGSAGTALLAVVLQQQIAATVPGSGGSLTAATGNTAGLAQAFDHAFWWAVVLTGLTMLPALFLLRKEKATA